MCGCGFLKLRVGEGLQSWSRNWERRGLDELSVMMPAWTGEKENKPWAKIVNKWGEATRMLIDMSIGYK